MESNGSHARPTPRPDARQVVARALFLLLLGLAGLEASAELIDLGNGLVNDTTQNITWLKDAHHVQTLCTAADPIWLSFDLSSVVGGSGRTNAVACGGGGFLDWTEAAAWMVHLNANSYLGFNDWRLPRTGQPDSDCAFFTADGIDNDQGPGCLGSELGHLWTVPVPDGLENPTAIVDVGNGVCPNGACLLDSGPFDNFLSSIWSETEYAPDLTRAWHFVPGLGHSQPASKNVFQSQTAWPVRTGVTAPQVEIPTLSEWALILLALTLAIVGVRWAGR